MIDRRDNVRYLVRMGGKLPEGSMPGLSVPVHSLKLFQELTNTIQVVTAMNVSATQQGDVAGNILLRRLAAFPGRRRRALQ